MMVQPRIFLAPYTYWKERSTVHFGEQCPDSTWYRPTVLRMQRDRQSLGQLHLISTHLVLPSQRGGRYRYIG
jgi:hypothetical protein